jgi:hypothetical protein
MQLVYTCHSTGCSCCAAHRRYPSVSVGSGRVTLCGPALKPLVTRPLSRQLSPFRRILSSLTRCKGLRRSQGVTTSASETRPPSITYSPPPPAAPPRNALAPARSCCTPTTTSLQAIPHVWVAANAHVSSKNSQMPDSQITHLNPPKLPPFLLGPTNAGRI